MRKFGVIANLVFALVVIYCHFSGNDKAPFFVLLTLALMGLRQWFWQSEVTGLQL